MGRSVRNAGSGSQGIDRVRTALCCLAVLLAIGCGGAGGPGGEAVTEHEDLLKDRTPPEVTVTSPQEGESVSGTITVTGTASDDRALVRVEVQVDQGAFQIATGKSSWSFPLDTRTLAAGPHLLTARAVDKRGRTAQTQRSFVVQQPSPGPGVLDITHPLQLDRTEVAPGETLTGTIGFTNHGSSAVTVQQVVIAARPPGADLAAGPYWDLTPALGATTVAPGAALTVTATRTVTASDVEGTYIAFGTWQDATGAWIKGPDVSFTVRSQATCVPTTCAAAGKNCGTLSDGCGGTLSCGGCTSPQTCGGGGVPNVCGDSTGGGAQGPIRIMPVGDSITAASGGYRCPLRAMLLNAGRNVDLVGSEKDPYPRCADADHEGHSGWTIGGIAGAINGWLATYQPHYVLLAIGTNDTAWWTNQTAEQIADQHAALVDQILAAQPGVWVIAGSIPPQSSQIIQSVNVDRAQLTVDYNAAMAQRMQQRMAAGKRVRFADHHAALTLADLYDGIHPDDGGGQKMAQVWFDALTPVLP